MQPSQTQPNWTLSTWNEPIFPPRVWDVRELGGRGDGVTDDTSAIRRAIDACAQAGGGRVLIPAGEWLTGPIHLRSHVELHVARGATVKLSRNINVYRSADLAGLPGVKQFETGTARERHLVYHQRGGVRLYGFSPQIYAYKARNIAITGEGVFDGQGDAWWPWVRRQPGIHTLFAEGAAQVPLEERIFGLSPDEDDQRGGVRPPMFQTIECDNVLLNGPTFRNGSSWMLHPVMTDHLVIRNIEVLAPSDAPNTDGIDPDMCRNVLIEHVHIATGDDAVCIKAGRDQDAWSVGRPTENVTIRDVRITSGRSGIAIGSEASTLVRNVFVERVEIHNALRGIRIKSGKGRGGVCEDILIRDVTCSNIGARGKPDMALVNITLRYGSFKSTTETLPTFRRIHIENVRGQGNGKSLELLGLPEQPIREVTLRNLDLIAAEPPVIEHVEPLVQENVRCETEAVAPGR